MVETLAGVALCVYDHEGSTVTTLELDGGTEEKQEEALKVLSGE